MMLKNKKMLKLRISKKFNLINLGKIINNLN
jgi:hypothetical protein